LLFWRARALAPDQQVALRQEVLVARGGLREQPVDLEPDVERMYRARQNEASVRDLDPQFAKQQLRALVRAQQETVAPNFRRIWDLDLGARRLFLRDRPLVLRVKFHAARQGDLASVNTVWLIGDVASGRFERSPRQLTANVFQELPVPPNLFSDDGKLHIECENRDAVTLLFPLEDGLELLYPEGGFLLNYERGVGIIFCWLSLLAAIGLAASTFLSFPVAALLTAALVLIGLSGGTISGVLREGTAWGFDYDTGQAGSITLDWLLLPIFRVLSFVVDGITSFSPIEALTTGRSIGWMELGRAAVQIIGLAGGGFAVVGIVFLTRRQLGQHSLTG